MERHNKHSEAGHDYATWRDLVKPRQGPAFDLIKMTRQRLKYALRQKKIPIRYGQVRWS